MFVCTLEQLMMRENVKRGSDKRKRLLHTIKDDKCEKKGVSVIAVGREDEDNLPSVVYDMCGTLAP